MTRHYIKTINHENDHDTYEFTQSIEGAWHWETKGEAERNCCAIVERGGITADASPAGIPTRGFCTDFRVESRPQGGFAISCEPNI
jgi:hypothetical protein